MRQALIHLFASVLNPSECFNTLINGGFLSGKKV